MQISDNTNAGSEWASTDSTGRLRLLVMIWAIAAWRRKQNSRDWLPGRKANITCKTRNKANFSYQRYAPLTCETTFTWVNSNSFDGFCFPEGSQSAAYEKICQESVKGKDSFHVYRLVFFKLISFRGIPNNRNPSFFRVKPWTTSIIKATYLYWESSTKNSRHLFHKQFPALSETTSTCAWEKEVIVNYELFTLGKKNWRYLFLEHNNQKCYFSDRISSTSN